LQNYQSNQKVVPPHLNDFDGLHSIKDSEVNIKDNDSFEMSKPPRLSNNLTPDKI